MSLVALGIPIVGVGSVMWSRGEAWRKAEPARRGLRFVQVKRLPVLKTEDD